MHERILLTAILLCVIAVGHTQAFQENDLQKNIKVFDAEGKPFVNPDLDAEGTQFFIPEWKSGTIKLNSNYVYNNVSVRLNLQSQEVHYLNQGKVEMAVSPELIKELFIYDTAKGQTITYDFQCGFPALDKQTDKDFYLVLSNGKLKLLKSIKKELDEKKDNVFSAPKKEFVTTENYFIYDKSNNSLHLLRLNKTSISELLHDQESKVDAYAKENKLSYKKSEDVKQIIDYYNTL